MKESDVRARIDSFLRRAMLPAALGIALSACSGEPNQPVSKYSAPPPDGAADVADPVAEYMAPMPDGGGTPAIKYMAVMPDPA